MTHTLHQQLVKLRDRAHAWLAGGYADGFSPWHGICAGLRPSLYPSDRRLLADLATQWPGYSSDRTYPVSHPAMDPQEAFNRATPQEMWRPKFEYARNRWALLEWLIEQTKPTEESQS